MMLVEAVAVALGRMEVGISTNRGTGGDIIRPLCRIRSTTILSIRRGKMGSTKQAKIVVDANLKRPIKDLKRPNRSKRPTSIERLCTYTKLVQS